MFSWLAHISGPLTPGDVWHHWSLDPVLFGGLCLMAYLYFKGRLRLRHWARWRDGMFWGGMVLLAIALMSPLDALGETLLVAHMAQHLLLFIVVPVLFSLSMPMLPLLWSLPDTWRHRMSRWGRVRRLLSTFMHPITACLFYWGMMWLWHMPALYQWALRSEVMHITEHISFFAAGMLFWWAIIHPRSPRLIGYGAGVLLIFLSAMQGVVLGALMTFARYPWYPIYEERVIAWSLTALEDQQLAGLMMWILPGILYVGAAAVLIYHWFRLLDDRYKQRTPDTRGVSL